MSNSTVLSAAVLQADLQNSISTRDRSFTAIIIMSYVLPIFVVIYASTYANIWKWRILQDNMPILLVVCFCLAIVQFAFVLTYHIALGKISDIQAQLNSMVSTK